MGGWGALKNIREWSGTLPDVQDRSGDRSRMSGSGRDSLTDVRVWSGTHADLWIGLEASRMSRSGREAM